MSYEGYREFLCAVGHRSVVDCWEDDPEECSCGEKMTHVHSVDVTNGAEDDVPQTVPAPVEPIGTDDVWHEDHYGNKYATQRVRYKPLAEWRAISQPNS